MDVIIKDYIEDIPFEMFYRKKYEEFDTEPYEKCVHGTSLLINDLELEIDEDAKVRLVAGYAPLNPHHTTRKYPKRFEKGSIYFSFDPKRVPAGTHQLNNDGAWPLYFNEKRGWICIGDPEIKDRQLVEFAPDAVASIKKSKIVALWLKPEFI